MPAIGSPSGHIPSVYARPKVKPRKYLPVVEGDTFTVDEVDKLIEDGFTHYAFPDGATPLVLPLTGFGCLAEELIYDEYMNQFMWTSIMAAGWVPANPHKV